MVAWTCKALQIFENVCVFWKNDFLRGNFCNSVPKVFISTRSTCCVQISWNFAEEKSVKSCVACLTKKKQNLPGYPAVATRRIAPKICQGQCPKMCSECSRFHPNRFTLSGVTAERVNTAKRRRKVNPIFGGGLSSSRIIKQNDRSHHRHRWYLTTNFKCRTHIVFNTNIITIEELLSSQATTVCKISTLSEHIVYVYKRRWSSLLALYSVYCLFPKRETYLFHKSYPT